MTKVQANFESIAQPIQAAVNASPPGRRLEATMDDFAHSIPAFIDVLEDIGKIHPYLNGEQHRHHNAVLLTHTISCH